MSEIDQARDLYDRWTLNAFVQDLPLDPAFHSESDRRFREIEAAIRQPYIEAINDVLTDFPECSVMETSIDRTEVCKTHQWVLPCPYARLRALLQPEQGEPTNV